MKKFLSKEKFGRIRNQDGILQRREGITLIALIVTIVIILIIAGVGISVLGNDDGILSKAVTARKENLKSESEEQLKVKLSEYLVNNQGISDLNQLDGISIDGYEVNSTSTGRVITMSKDGESFSYLVDENYSVISVGNVIAGTSGNVTRLDFEPQIIINSNGQATIKVPDDIVTKYNPTGYLYIIDGKMKNCSMNNGYTCNLLSNKVEVILMDENKNMSTSKSITTNVSIANFSYTGNTETVYVKAGKYTFEVWGSQGGGSLRRKRSIC